MSFVSSKGNILCRLIKIELYKIFAIINRAIKGLHCNSLSRNSMNTELNTISGGTNMRSLLGLLLMSLVIYARL